jgi:hypothetical protein
MCCSVMLRLVKPDGTAYIAPIVQHQRNASSGLGKTSMYFCVTAPAVGQRPHYRACGWPETPCSTVVALCPVARCDGVAMAAHASAGRPPSIHLAACRRFCRQGKHLQAVPAASLAVWIMSACKGPSDDTFEAQAGAYKRA